MLSGLGSYQATVLVWLAMYTVALISRKGGAGKTTLACGLAVAGEQAGLTTALVDLDPQGSASAWAGLRASDAPVVVPGSAPQLAALLAAARSAAADLAIIDTAPHSTGAALKAAQAADLVLIPCRASVADLHAIGTSIEISRTAKTAAAVVLNAAPVQGPLVSQAQAAIAGYEVAMVPVVLHQRIAHVHAFTNGLTAPELARTSKAAGELAALFDWVRKEGRLQDGQD